MEIAMPAPTNGPIQETTPQAESSSQAGQKVHATRPAWLARWGKRAGVIAFLFFFIKGLAWLVVPVALATWWAQ